MSSASEGKTCKTDVDLSSEVEETERTLDSSLDEILCANVEETFSEWRAGVMVTFSCKTLWKVEELLLKDE